MTPKLITISPASANETYQINFNWLINASDLWHYLYIIVSNVQQLRLLNCQHMKFPCQRLYYWKKDKKKLKRQSNTNYNKNNLLNQICIVFLSKKPCMRKVVDNSIEFPHFQISMKFHFSRIHSI